MLAVGMVVPDVLLGGGGGEAEAVVVVLSCVLPEGDGFLDAVPEPAWAGLSDEEATGQFRVGAGGAGVERTGPKPHFHRP